VVTTRIRVFVWVFLVAFFVCGFARIEAWPFTGWRLFSISRKPVQTSWIATTVDGRGIEHDLPLAAMGDAYRGASLVLGGFATLPRGKQVAVCDALQDGARAAGQDVAAVRIYSEVRDVSRRAGDRGAPGIRTLRFTCGGGTIASFGGAQS
jgi:hypothetical protein